jgi:hypothetical protein
MCHACYNITCYTWEATVLLVIETFVFVTGTYYIKGSLEKEIPKPVLYLG